MDISEINKLAEELYEMNRKTDDAMKEYVLSHPEIVKWRWDKLDESMLNSFGIESMTAICGAALMHSDEIRTMVIKLIFKRDECLFALEDGGLERRIALAIVGACVNPIFERTVDNFAGK